MISRSQGGPRVAWAASTLLIAALIAHAAAGAPGDDPADHLTLAEARARARAASPVLLAAREAVAAARGAERQAGAFPNPSVAYSHEETSRSGETNREDIALIEQPLEIAGQRGLRREAARLRREAAAARLGAAELELDFDVARAYAEAVAAERRTAHANEAAQAFAHAREVNAQRRVRGDVSGYENRRTALEAARYEALRAAAELEQRAARAVLASLLAPSPENTPTFEARLEDTLDATLPSEGLSALRAAALQRHPEILAAELARRAEEVEVRLARREVVPDPTLGLGYKHERTAGDSRSWQGFAAQLNVPVPIWDRRGGSVEAAEAEARGGAADVRRVRRRIALAVEQAWNELRAASEQIEAIRPQLGSEAEAALLAARTAYREGEIALVEWLDAVRAYYEVESTYAGLLADHFIRRAALERAVGGSLF